MLRVSRSSHGATGGDVTIEGTDEDIAIIELMMMGTVWARRGIDGMEKSEAYYVLPTPVDDPQLVDHWPPTDPLVPPAVQYKLFVDDAEHEKQTRAKAKVDFRAIFVSGLAAYAGQPIYEQRARRMEAAGFICMRSRRGKDGHYCEFWYMPSPLNATGEAKGKTTEEIVHWLMHEIGPGSISVEGVHWGAAVD